MAARRRTLRCVSAMVAAYRIKQRTKHVHTATDQPNQPTNQKKTSHNTPQRSKMSWLNISQYVCPFIAVCPGNHTLFFKNRSKLLIAMPHSIPWPTHRTSSTSLLSSLESRKSASYCWSLCSLAARSSNSAHKSDHKVCSMASTTQEECRFAGVVCQARRITS